MRTSFIPVVVSVLLSACAAGPVATSRTNDVPASRILTQKWRSQSPGTGRLVVKRDSGVVRAACDIRVSVDNTPVADLRPAEKIALFLPAGDHVIKGETKGICRGGASEITMEISADAERIVRIVSGKKDGIELRGTFF